MTVPGCSLASWRKGPEPGHRRVPSVSLVEGPLGRLLPELSVGGRRLLEGLRTTPASVAGSRPCRVLVEVGTAAGAPPTP